MGRILEGRVVAEHLRTGSAADREALAAAGTSATLALVRVGGDPAATTRRDALAREGPHWSVTVRDERLEAAASIASVRRRLRTLARDPQVHGVVLLRPLPPGMPHGDLAQDVAPAKDVEGVHPESLGRLLAGRSALAHPFARACLALARAPGDLAGRPVVLIGPPAPALALAAQAFRQAGARVTLADAEDRAPARTADVLVAATGIAEGVGPDDVRPGAVVLDAGVHVSVGSDGRARLVGDVAFAAVLSQAGWLTPVPGGLGPVLTAALLANVLRAARGAPPPEDPARWPLFAGGS